MAIRKTVAAVLTTGMVLSMMPLTSLAQNKGRAPDYVKDTWKQSGGKWYFYDESGKKIKDTWALIDTTDNDKCDGGYYHFDKNGAMEKNKWVYYSDSAYYYDEYDEYYYSGTAKGWRYLGSDGKAVTGWKKISKKWYYFNSYGDWGSDWHDSNDKSGSYGYYDGIMASGVQIIDSKIYYFDNNGVMQKSRWIKAKYYYDGDFEEGDQNWYDYYMYVGSSGAAYVGWHKIGGKWYYFADHQQGCYGCMMRNTLIGDDPSNDGMAGIYSETP